MGVELSIMAFPHGWGVEVRSKDDIEYRCVLSKVGRVVILTRYSSGARMSRARWVYRLRSRVVMKRSFATYRPLKHS